MESKFGRRLETARLNKHLTREELSSMIGVPSSVLRDMEVRNSATRKVYDILPKISKALGVSILWLLSGHESNNTDVLKHVQAIKTHADQIASSVRD